MPTPKTTPAENPLSIHRLEISEDDLQQIVLALNIRILHINEARRKYGSPLDRADCMLEMAELSNLITRLEVQCK